MAKRAVLIALVGLVEVAAAIIGDFENQRRPMKSSATISIPTVSPSPGEVAADSASLDMAAIPDIPDRPQGQRVKVNGISMYYEVFGEGEPLLLINGGAATIESWFGQIPEFRGHYQIIAADSRGHGRTADGDGPINFDLLASDYVALLDHLGVKNVSVVGWSDGGVIGLRMAISRADLVKRLVTLGSHSRPEGMTAEFRREIEGSSPENFPAILVDGYKALSPDGPEHWPVVFNKLKTMWLTLPDIAEADLEKIKSPVLLLVGEHDIIRRDESERLARLLPGASLRVLKGASHYSPVEIPKVVNAAILEFLGQP